VGNENAWWTALVIFGAVLVTGLLSRIPGLLFDTVEPPAHDETAPPTDAP